MVKRLFRCACRVIRGEREAKEKVDGVADGKGRDCCWLETGKLGLG